MSNMRSNYARTILPVYMVLDASSSMHPQVGILNDVIGRLIDAIRQEPLVAERTRLCIISFSSHAEVLLKLADALEITALPLLEAGGATNYSSALDLLRTTIEHDVSQLKSEGFRVVRPAVFFLTDGRPTDSAGRLSEGWKKELYVLNKLRSHPTILVFGLGTVDPEVVLQLASAPQLAFISRAGIGPAEAIADFGRVVEASFKSVIQSIATGTNELLIPRPELFDNIPTT